MYIKYIYLKLVLRCHETFDDVKPPLIYISDVSVVRTSDLSVTRANQTDLLISVTAESTLALAAGS